MTRIFTDAGEHVPVTVLRLAQCQVVAHRTKDKNGYVALQLGVHAAAKLVADQHVGDQRHGDHRDRDGEPGEQDDPAAEGHGSRSTYPTPRTVWIRRGLPPDSVLRRR